jgi:hypothetical protein
MKEDILNYFAGRHRKIRRRRDRQRKEGSTNYELNLGVETEYCH